MNTQRRGKREVEGDGERQIKKITRDVVERSVEESMRQLGRGKV